MSILIERANTRPPIVLRFRWIATLSEEIGAPVEYGLIKNIQTVVVRGVPGRRANAGDSIVAMIPVPI